MSASAIEDVLRTYQGSDGEATKALFARLVAPSIGNAGQVAVELFRAQKASERAKVYRGGGYRGAAYDRKNWALSRLCNALTASQNLGITWGWGLDEKTPGFEHVLYVDLPTGQVSFHSGHRMEGPGYPGQWDGVPGQSADRVCRWIARLLEGRA
jgi:hypothetical protein